MNQGVSDWPFRIGLLIIVFFILGTTYSTMKHRQEAYELKVIKSDCTPIQKDDLQPKN